jgi:hypothetical protein
MERYRQKQRQREIEKERKESRDSKGVNARNYLTHTNECLIL